MIKRFIFGDTEGAESAISAAMEAGHLPDLDEISSLHRVRLGRLRSMVETAAIAHQNAFMNTQLKRDTFDRAAAVDLGVKLGLDQERAEANVMEFIRSKVQMVVNAIMSDGVVDPEEDRDLQSILASFGAVIDTQTAQMIEDAKRLWAVSNLPLKPVSAPILLRRGEECFYVVEAEALEDRQRTVRVGYHGPSVRIRLAKGFYYNVGSFTPSRKTEGYQHSFGIGALCFTNKRLLWVSPERSLTVAIPKVVRYDPYADGLRIFKETGKPLTFFYTSGNDKTASIIASRVLEEMR